LKRKIPDGGKVTLSNLDVYRDSTVPWVASLDGDPVKSRREDRWEDVASVLHQSAIIYIAVLRRVDPAVWVKISATVIDAPSLPAVDMQCALVSRPGSSRRARGEIWMTLCGTAEGGNVKRDRVLIVHVV